MRSLLGKASRRVVNAAAGIPVPLTTNRSNPFAVQDRHTGDATAQMRAMGQVGTLFSIVSRLASSTALVNWDLFRDDGTEGDDRTKVETHLALDKWAKPNPWMPRQEFVECFEQHLELTGEAYWVISSNSFMPGIPSQMWPVRPDRMTPVPHVTDFLAGWIYTSPDGEEVPLKINEVIQIRMPNPLDPYRGMGPVQAIQDDLAATRFASAYNKNFFVNSAEPGGIIQVDKRLSDEEFNEMTSRWNMQHRGVARAHRVALLEQGQWIDRKYTNRDMEFSQLRMTNRDTIMEAFSMSKHMLGISDDVNRANAEAGEVMFARYQTVPRCERIKGVLNQQYLPLFGSTGVGVYFDYENPVPDNDEAENQARTSKANAASTLVLAGWNPDDVLEAMGLPPMEFKAPEPKVVVAPPDPNAPKPPDQPNTDPTHNDPNPLPGEKENAA